MLVKKAMGQLLGGRNRRGFWVPGEKETAAREEGGLPFLEREETSSHVRSSEEHLQAGAQG